MTTEQSETFDGLTDSDKETVGTENTNPSIHNPEQMKHAINEILTYLDLCHDKRRMPGDTRPRAVHPAQCRRLECASKEYMDFLCTPEQQEQALETGTGLNVLYTPLNSCFIVDSSGEDQDHRFSLVRCVKLNPKLWRGRIRSVPPDRIDLAIIHLYEDGTFSVNRFPMGRLNGAWERLEHDAQTKINDYLAIATSAAVALQYRRERSLSVELENINGFGSINITTDHIGIRELFKLREREEGRIRRSPIINWVQHHWRKNRVDEESEIYVRKHLRGRETFEWADLKCTVHPSIPDIMKNDELRGMRKELQQKQTRKKKKKR